MLIRQTVPNDFPKHKSNEIKTKAFDLGVLFACLLQGGRLVVFIVSFLKISK